MTAIRIARPAALPPADTRYVVVEASAGTGKTFFLEHRVVDLVIAGGADLGQILLVTFTDKAVAELRMRIRDLLDRLSRATADTAAPGAPCWEVDDAARARLRAALTAFDRAPIFTIHGFCHRILVEDAFAARRLFDQAQVADDVAFEAAFSALLRERFARGGSERELLAAHLERGGTVDALRDLLLQCARANARPRRQLDAPAVRALMARLCALFSPLNRPRILAAVIRGGTGHHESNWLAAIGHVVDPIIAAGLDTCSTPHLLAAIDAIRKPGETLAKRADRHAPLAVLDDLVAVPTLTEAVTSALLGPVLDRVAADKAEHGQFDYDDMLALVREALAGPRGPELAARLRERTPWVMIDEFQDTDPTQWEIFRDVWTHADARGLTIVGDPKQAIYAFRGADVATYLAARQELQRAGAVTVPLDVNRRSTPQLVAAVNHVLIGTLGTPLLTGDIAYDAPVTASGDVTCDDPRAPIQVFWLRGPGRDENRRALAQAIGGEIEALRRAPLAWQRRGVPQPFSLSDCLVLTRGKAESAEIAQALRQRGLPCSLVESDKLFETREAAELAAVLAAVATPRDRGARLRALRTRFFDVPWSELARVVDAPDHHPPIARLFDWAGVAARRGYEALFRRIVEESGFAERALVAGGGERALTNTWHLLELLLGEVARARCDLHELVGQLRRWIADGGNERFDHLDVQRAETDADAVRVLTMHKAKGLEAPYVFLYGGAKRPPSSKVHTVRDADGRRLVVDPIDEGTTGRLATASNEENQRLAYVALTRAQVRLYLPRYHPRAFDEKSMYAEVQKCIAQVDDVAGFDVVPIDVYQVDGRTTTPDALAGFTPSPAPALVEPPPLEGARGGLVMLSYTRLAHDLSAAVPAGPARGVAAPLALDAQEFDLEEGDETLATASELPANELPAGAASGLLLHYVLEHADLAVARAAPDAAAWAADPTVRGQLAEGAALHGVLEQHLPHAAQLAHATLTAPLALVGGGALPPLVAATALAREVEFAFPLPGPAPVRGLVKGYIDALVAWDDELWVLDYKSDRLVGADLDAAALARAHERYAVQMRLYAIAAARLRGARRLAGLLFAFVRHGRVVPVRVDAATLDDWTSWLAALPTRPREARA